MFTYSKLKDHKKCYPPFLPNFVVTYIDNTFLNMCTILVCTIFCISATFCLPGIFSRSFAVPFFTNPYAPRAVGIVAVVNCHILPTSI